MTSFIEYIEKSCAGLKDTQMSYLYKKSILDKMTDRANEITHAGLKDEAVIADLMQDEFPNLAENFPAWEKAEKKRRMAKLMRWIMGIGGVIVFFAALITFFVVGEKTTFTYYIDGVAQTASGYRQSWLIIVGAIFGLIIFYTSFGIKKICKMRRVFHPIARALIVLCVMLIMVFAFLCALMLAKNPQDTIRWPIVIAGIVLALVADIFFAFATKQKFRTITTMIYMPIISTMLFVILNAYGLVGSFGWLVIISGVIVDIIYALSIVASNAKYFMYKQEDDE
jgi:MFS family permease